MALACMALSYELDSGVDGAAARAAGRRCSLGGITAVLELG